jgi:sugar transferase (PEP-CTERM/EpsH1 system associated)
VGRVICQLINKTKASFAHAVCCLRRSGPLAEVLAGVQVPVVVTGKREGHDWGLSVRVARVCRRLRPDIVHTHNWSCVDGIVGARLARVPRVIHTDHGRDIDDLCGERRIRRAVRRLLGYAVDRQVAVSDDIATWLVNEVGIRRERVTVVRNGVDPAQRQPSADRAVLRQRLGYDAEDVVVGAIGRLEPVKDYATLVDAFAALVEVCPRARLLIVGEGSERARLELCARDRGLLASFRFLGHRNDIADCLAVMDVFAQPSLMEGTSNAVIEAMFLRLPVVATRVGGNAETVVDGVTGRLVACRDPKALRDALAYYCARRELRVEHGCAGYERVCQRYSVEQMVLGYSALYSEVLPGRGFPAAMLLG